MPLKYTVTISSWGERRWPWWSEERQEYIHSASMDEDGEDVPLLPLEDPCEFVLYNSIVDVDFCVSWPDIDRTVLHRLMRHDGELPAPTKAAVDALVAALVQRVVAPCVSVFDVLTELGQPFGLANGKVLQVALNLWFSDRQRATQLGVGPGFWPPAQQPHDETSTPTPPPPLLLPPPIGSTAVWWEGRMVSIDQWPCLMRPLLLETCRAILGRMNGISVRQHLPWSPEQVPCNREHDPEIAADPGQLCTFCLQTMLHEAHGWMGPLTLIL